MLTSAMLARITAIGLDLASETTVIEIVQDAIREASDGNNSTALALQVPGDWPSDYAEQFWASYPNRKGKIDALKALDKVAFAGKTAWRDLIDGLERYKVSSEVARGFVKHPATWLNKGCWKDEEGPLQRNSSAGFFEVLADMGKS